MGTSTDAILFYGFAWNDEYEKPWLLWRNRGGTDEDFDKAADLPFEDYLSLKYPFKPSADNLDRAALRAERKAFDK